VLTFKRGSYLIDVAWEVANGSDKAIAPHAYFQLQRDDVAPAGESAMVSTFTGPAVFTDAEKYQKVDFSSIADNKAKFAKTADNGWLAMVQHYFVSPPGYRRKRYPARVLHAQGGRQQCIFQAGVIVPVAEIAPGAKGETSVGLYAGPQEQAANST
jgi:YidC/Oxa1 family membrane protein insertase